MGTHPIFESDFDCLTDGDMESDLPHIVNLINSVIGVGILAMPFCMAQCGLVLGLVVLVVCGMMTLESSLMLIKSAKSKNKKTYEYLAQACFGSTGKFAIEFAQIGLMLGTCIAFYIVISSLLVEVSAPYFLEPGQVEDAEARRLLRRYFCVFIGFFIVLPLGLMRDMSSIAFFAYFSSCFYIVFISIITYRSVMMFDMLSFEWLNHVELFNPSGIFKVLPIFALAYACQSQLFIIYSTMADPPIARIRSIMLKMLSIVAFVYSLVGILGYSTFRGEIKGNMLLNYENDDTLRLIKLGFAMSVVVGFPLMIYPCRQSIFTLFIAPRMPTYKSLNDDATFIPNSTFRTLTLTIVTITMVIAVLVENVETILGLNGALMGTFIAFILPGLCYSKTLALDATWSRRLANMIIMVGVASMGLGIIQNLPAGADMNQA